jgi:hypothetical protein
MKKIILTLFVSVAILNCALAHADSITGVITGDDNISYWNGSAWVAEGNNWQIPETINLNINQSSQEEYFAVVNNNWYPGGNPAGFLASFTDNTGTFVQTATNTLLSNTSTVQVLASSQWTATTGPFPLLSAINPTVTPSTLTGWTIPTSYGANGWGPETIWQSVSGGSLNSINPGAQWLWTANNDQTYATQDDYAYFEINLGVSDGIAGSNSVVPEPPTILLFAFACAMVMFFNIRRIKSERRGIVPL